MENKYIGEFMSNLDEKIKQGEILIDMFNKHVDVFNKTSWSKHIQGNEMTKKIDIEMDEKICKEKMRNRSQWPFKLIESKQPYELLIEATKDYPEDYRNYCINRIRTVGISIIDEARFGYYLREDVFY